MCEVVRNHLRLSSVALAVAALAPALSAQTLSTEMLPTGGVVKQGEGAYSTVGDLMTVSQTSNQMVMDWQSFSIAAGTQVKFDMPGPRSVALNRVVGSEMSTIAGRLEANGRVFLLNPNGVLFAKEAQVDVGGLVASTLGMSDDDFVSGSWRLTGHSLNRVTNHGTIRTPDGGAVAFVAAHVINTGTITAPKGAVQLVAAGRVLVDLGGSILMEVEEGVLEDARIEQSGTISAAEGTVYLSAKTVNAVKKSVINNSGLIEANSVTATGGRVFLEADEIHLDAGTHIDVTGARGGGTALAGGGNRGARDLRQATHVTMDRSAVIDASATGNGNGGEVALRTDMRNPQSHTRVAGQLRARGARDGAGGKVITSGAKLELGNLVVDAGAPGGRGGRWVKGSMESVTIDDTAAANMAHALNTGTNVLLSTATVNGDFRAGVEGEAAGDITGDSAIRSSNSNASLTLKAHGNLNVKENVDVGGSLGLEARGALQLDAPVSAGGSVQLQGRTIRLNAALAAVGNSISLKGVGDVTQGAGGSLTAANLLLLGGNVNLGNAGNTVDTLAVRGVSRLHYLNSKAMEIGTAMEGFTEVHGVTAEGPVYIGTDWGDLTVAKNVHTTDTTGDAVVLNAGQGSRAGTAAGGNVVRKNLATVTSGEDGLVRIYTGEIGTHFGHDGWASQGWGRYRYNADANTDFSSGDWTALDDSGSYIIYRQQPKASLGDHTMVYGESVPTLNAKTRTVNGDVTWVRPVNPKRSASNHLSAGSYSLGSDLDGLGYDVVDKDSAALTVTPRPITVKGGAHEKTYGEADPPLKYELAEGSSMAFSDQLSLTRESGENEGRYAVSVQDDPNYQITYETGFLRIKPRLITVNVGDSHRKMYGDADPAAFEYEVLGEGMAFSDQLSLTRDPGEDVGNYVVRVARKSNYSIQQKTGVLRIEPRPIAIRIDDRVKRIGDPEPVWTYRSLEKDYPRAHEKLEFTRIPGENFGYYRISATHRNYSIEGDPAYLAIVPRVVTATHVNGLLTVAPVPHVAQSAHATAVSRQRMAVHVAAAQSRAGSDVQVVDGGIRLPAGVH